MLPVPATPEAITLPWFRHVLPSATSITVDEIGTDFGFGGETHLVRATLPDRSVGSHVVKLAAAERTQREIAFYTGCAPTTPVTVPGYVAGGTDDERGVVVLEYLSDMRQGDVLAGSTPAEMSALAAQLAVLHGRWWGGHHPDLGTLRTPRPWPQIREGRIGTALERYASTASAQVIAAIELLPSQLDDALDALQDVPATLTHRDLHLDNVLFDADDHPCILDWQNAAVGPPAMDVARMFVECRPTTLSSSVVDQTITAYRSHLDAHGVEPTDEGDLFDRIHAALVVQLTGTVN